MNAEILARLERSFSPDPAALIVEALAPLPEMTLEDRIRAGQLIADLGAILLKGKSLTE